MSYYPLFLDPKQATLNHVNKTERQRETETEGRRLEKEIERDTHIHTHTPDNQKAVHNDRGETRDFVVSRLCI